MNRYEKQADAKIQQNALEVLKTQYRELATHPVIIDIMRQLQDQYDGAYQSAVSEMENAHKSASSLQAANAYVRIRSYITEMML